MYGLSIWNGKGNGTQRTKRRSKTCFLIRVTCSPFRLCFFWRGDIPRRVLAPFLLVMRMNTNAETARFHLCLDTNTLPFTPLYECVCVCARDMSKTLHIYKFFFATLVVTCTHFLKASEREGESQSYTRFHIAIFLIFTLSSIIKFYGIFVKAKRKSSPIKLYGAFHVLTTATCMLVLSVAEAHIVCVLSDTLNRKEEEEKKANINIKLDWIDGILHIVDEDDGIRMYAHTQRITANDFQPSFNSHILLGMKKKTNCVCTHCCSDHILQWKVITNKSRLPPSHPQKNSNNILIASCCYRNCFVKLWYLD